VTSSVAEHAIWADLLSPDERMQLAPRTDPLPRRPDVLVVGGGMLGLATAAAAKRAGLGSVLVIERQHLAAGATGGSAGMLVPEGHAGIDPPWFVELMRASLELWRELEASWPGGVGLQEVDWLGLDPRPTPDNASVRPGVERLDAQAVQALVPQLAEPRGGVLARRQGRVNPLRAALRLAAGLEAVATGVEALEVECHAERIVAVETSAGRIQPGAVIFATGTPPSIAGLGLEGIPGGYVKGHLLVTEPAPFRLPGFVAPLATQIEDGRLLVGGSLDVGDSSPAIRPEVVATLWSGLTSQLASADGLRISHQWCCFRPWHPGSTPILDQLPGLRNAWLTSGHYTTGILMAPVSGQLLADWVASGVRPARAAGMELARLAASELA
jgi:glycine/D-amino acid oxidase-like deaminating enzyme